MPLDDMSNSNLMSFTNFPLFQTQCHSQKIHYLMHFDDMSFANLAFSQNLPFRSTANETTVLNKQKCLTISI